MIQNDRQYRMSRAQAERFAKALQDFDTSPPDDLDPLIVIAQRNAIEGQLAELRMAIEGYERLRDASEPTLELHSLDELPDALIKARIAAGLTQKELGERLGIVEQQIQRYESTRYASASFGRVSAVADALGVRVDQVVRLAGRPQVDTLVKALRSAGLGRDFAFRRLLPPSLGANVPESPDGSAATAARLAAVVARVFGGNAPRLLAGETPRDWESLAQAQFKSPANADEDLMGPYAAYAGYLTSVLVSCLAATEPGEISRDPARVRSALPKGMRPTYRAVLEYTWDLGILVVPLADPGAFHAATWRHEGLTAIVLKQRVKAPARWAFDLLHELWHAAEHSSNGGFTHAETKENMELGASSDDDEVSANEFAGRVLLGDDADHIARQAVAQARGSVELLKSVVPRVAAEADVAPDALANFLAYRLSLQGLNWWGAATNLQVAEDPWLLTRDFLMGRVDFRCMDEIDRDLVTAALVEA